MEAESEGVDPLVAEGVLHDHPIASVVLQLVAEGVVDLLTVLVDLNGTFFSHAVDRHGSVHISAVLDPVKRHFRRRGVEAEREGIGLSFSFVGNDVGAVFGEPDFVSVEGDFLSVLGDRDDFGILAEGVVDGLLRIGGDDLESDRSAVAVGIGENCDIASFFGNLLSRSVGIRLTVFG